MKKGVVPSAVRINGYVGYDLQVADPEVTVGDYLAALEEFLATAALDKRLNPGGRCLGCDLCCHERIPLTSIDYFHLVEHLTGGDGVAFLVRFTRVTVNGRVVDISLQRDEAGRCCFLDPREKMCRIYPVRPFVCRTFTCAPASRRARRLRSIVTNVGEDELVRVWLAASHRAGELVIHEADQPSVDPEDWGPTPFAGCRSFHEVPLKAVCPPHLWRVLCNGITKAGGTKVCRGSGPA